MLVTAEDTLKGSRGSILTVEWASSKRKSFLKKKKLAKKQKTKSRQKKEIPKKTSDKEKRFHYNIEGHWRRNIPTYLASVKNKKKDASFEGTSDLLIIETNLMILSSSSWILDSSSSTHLYTSIQDLEEIRGLREGEITL